MPSVFSWLDSTMSTSILSFVLLGLIALRIGDVTPPAARRSASISRGLRYNARRINHAPGIILQACDALAYRLEHSDRCWYSFGALLPGSVDRLMATGSALSWTRAFEAFGNSAGERLAVPDTMRAGWRRARGEAGKFEKADVVRQS